MEYPKCSVISETTDKKCQRKAVYKRGSWYFCKKHYKIHKKRYESDIKKLGYDLGEGVKLQKRRLDE